MRDLSASMAAGSMAPNSGATLAVRVLVYTGTVPEEEGCLGAGRHLRTTGAPIAFEPAARERLALRR